jgi:hypothetical protein
MLPKEIRNRIDEDALRKYGGMSKEYMPYKAGATAEAQRAQVLVGLLKRVINFAGSASCDDHYVEITWSLVGEIEQALTQYNKPEIKKP